MKTFISILFIILFILPTHIFALSETTTDPNSCGSEYTVATLDGVSADLTSTTNYYVSNGDYWPNYNKEIYLKFTPDASGDLTISEGTHPWGSDMKVKFYIGTSCGASDIVSSNGSSNSHGSFTFSITSGQTYYIKIEKKSDAYMRYSLTFLFTKTIASNSPDIEINPTSKNITLGTTSTTLDIELSEAANTGDITVNYTDCDGNNQSTTITQGDTSKEITIDSSSLTSDGDSCNVILTSKTGNGGQTVGSFISDTATITIASNSPNISLDPTTKDIALGTTSTTLDIKLSEAANTGGITVGYTDCDGSNQSTTITQGDTSKEITIDSSSLTSDGDSCNVILTSLSGNGGQTVGSITSDTTAITANSIPDETIPSGNANASTALCGSFDDVLQTRDDPSKIQHYSGADADIYNSPDCTLNTGEVDFGSWQHLNCSGGDATATGDYATELSVTYTGHTPATATVDATPSSSTTDETLTTSQTLSDTEYNKVEVGSGSTGSLSVDFSNLQKINTLNFTTNNSVTFSTSTPYNLEIGSVGVVNNGVNNSLATSSIPKNIKINSFDLPGGTIVDFEASQTIKVETFSIGRDSTNVTLKAQYVNINTLHQSNSGSGASTITIIADYIDIGDVDLDQEATLIIQSYTSGKRVLFQSNTISASSSSSMIIDSGNYYTDSFDIPGTGTSSSVIASSDTELINFYINGDFKPGNNPGINSTGNNGDFGSRPPENFILFINGDLETGGGGTTFNATVYVEGSTNFGSPSYLNGALSSGGDIDIGNSSKFYYDQDIFDDGWGECSSPTYQNQFSCGMFDSVLTSYDSIESTGNHDQACYTASISYPEGELTGDVTCNPSGCGGGGSCNRVDPPLNKLDYTVYTPTSSASSTTSTELTAIEYSDLSYSKTTIHFDPQTSYPDNSSIKMMVLGDIDVESSTLEFEPGDYFFESLTFEKNNNEVILPNDGPVRIFIKNDLSVNMNNLSFNTSGDQKNIFVYVQGDFVSLGNGGGTTSWKAYLYVEGEVTLNNNSNNWKIYGGITAEGKITINGNNPDFISDGTADDLGYGECALCYDENYVHTNGIFGMCMPMMFTCKTDLPIHNISSEELDSVKVIETYNSSMTMSFPMGSTYATLDKDGNSVGNGVTTNSSSDYSMFMMSLSLESDSIIYDFGDNYPTYSPDQDYYRAYKNITMSMSFDFNSWADSVVFLGTYTDKNSRDYNVRLKACEEFISGSATAGVFNAVQTSFTGTKDPLDLSDPQYALNALPTQISSQDFTIRILSLDTTYFTTPTNYSGDLNISIIQTPNYEEGDSTGNTQLCENSVSLTTPQSLTFVGDKYKDITINNISSATKSASIKISYMDSSTVKYVCSRDVFAIRPDKFTLSSPTGEDIELLTSAKDYNLSLIAQQYGSTTPTSEYSITTIDGSDFDLNTTKYMPDGTINSSLHGTPTFAYGSVAIVDGTGSNALSISFDDVGKINIKLIDTTWAKVDLDNSDTDANCNSDGAYICGDIDAIFIPSNFKLSSVDLHDHNDSTFTYLSNDLDMSASISLIVTAQNENNVTTENFSKDLWDNGIDINFSLPTISGLTSIKREISGGIDLDFASGVSTISINDTNTSKKLNFNFQRDISNSINPFKVNGSDLSVEVFSTFTASTSGLTSTITGSKDAINDATFLYGRTHASRQRFTDDNGTVNIYYETYCFKTDSLLRPCTKSLLPDGTNSKHTNDIRWFINENHNSSIDGNITNGLVVEKRTVQAVEEVSANRDTSTNHITKIKLKYDKSFGYPYKTTMENNASSWLIYNDYDSTATKNQFSVEFEGGDSYWSGVHETNSSTKDSDAIRTNRRSMW